MFPWKLCVTFFKETELWQSQRLFFVFFNSAVDFFFLWKIMVYIMKMKTHLFTGQRTDVQFVWSILKLGVGCRFCLESISSCWGVRFCLRMSGFLTCYNSRVNNLHRQRKWHLAHQPLYPINIIMFLVGSIVSAQLFRSLAMLTMEATGEPGLVVIIDRFYIGLFSAISLVEKPESVLSSD